jgi:cobalt-zinc-cadmium resistance protein CzcA
MGICSNERYCRSDLGKEVRRGVVTINGREEVVAGIVLKLFGQNTSEVIKRLEEKIPVVQRSYLLV